ncbi:hypothetical protein E2C01_096009 [Portunus trituberculatus]|uniref:Uncharacterized protein n=1 Tax=Portunus trituberculatus TaxID=210409 RepID=A0A5B7JWV4_PORTR|nr:hypothetical protein [Portunus trituberculatus]
MAWMIQTKRQKCAAVTGELNLGTLIIQHVRKGSGSWTLGGGRTAGGGRWLIHVSAHVTKRETWERVSGWKPGHHLHHHHHLHRRLHRSPHSTWQDSSGIIGVLEWQRHTKEELNAADTLVLARL